MIWGTIIMRKKYGGKDYFFAVVVTVGCSLFILYPVIPISISVHLLLNITLFRAR
jgi:hypothetical protein